MRHSRQAVIGDEVEVDGFSGAWKVMLVDLTSRDSSGSDLVTVEKEVWKDDALSYVARLQVPRKFCHPIRQEFGRIIQNVTWPTTRGGWDEQAFLEYLSKAATKVLQDAVRSLAHVARDRTVDVSEVQFVIGPVVDMRGRVRSVGWYAPEMEQTEDSRLTEG